MLVLSHYLQLNDRLSELHRANQINDYSETVRNELCDIFLEECGRALKDEIEQDALDSDEIAQLLSDFRGKLSFSEDKLRAHLDDVARAGAEIYIDEMLGQIT